MFQISIRIMIMSLILIGFSGCITQREFFDYERRMDFFNVTMEPLKRSDYVILGDVEGTARYEQGKFIIGSKSYDAKFNNFGVQGIKIPAYRDFDELEQAAIYDALSKIPEADFLISLRFEKTYVLTRTDTNLGLVASRRHESAEVIKVRGKAIKIKTDK